MAHDGYQLTRRACKSLKSEIPKLAACKALASKLGAA